MLPAALTVTVEGGARKVGHATKLPVVRGGETSFRRTTFTQSGACSAM
jgi:hypothetical protein